jgi:hypothetical protein
VSADPVLDDCPGVSLSSGFTRPGPAEQAEFRRQHREMQRELAPRIEEMDRCRRRAEALAHTAFIG